ncbi:MAG TPA: 30S ribosomal protein S4 [Peptococcaceae bacterium]|nr:MAG: 30S ribosomal protein S4 [Clostridia bacterium 41_269]HBT20943.1 30S ribosomal protein S4 [Peptococcaceae bacterium]
MARYTGPVCRLCRREGIKLYLKGERCYTNKCAVERRPYAPGQHGHNRKKLSEYGIQLREKQKVRRIYGINERQFRRYFAEAERQKGVTGEILMRLLERRLDNVVYRLGFAVSRPQARQIVLHGHVQVNGRKVNIPSYLVDIGDEVEIREKSKNLQIFQEAKEAARSVPKWLEVDLDQLKGKVVSFPTMEDLDIPVEPHLIVELYSR